MIAPHWCIPCMILKKFSAFMGSSMADQHFRFSGICSDPLLAKLYVRSEKFWGCENGMDLLYHYGEDGGVLTLHTTKGEKVCNVLCFFLHLTGRVCANDFAIKAFEYGN